MRPILLLLALVLLAPLAVAKEPPKVAVDIGTTETYAKPQDVAMFPATVSLIEGAPAWVGFELVSVTRGFIAPIPKPFVLDASRPETTLSLAMQTPFHNGYVNESGIAIYKITPRAGDESGAPGEPIVVQLVTHARGAYVPGAGALLTVLAVATLASSLTRERR